jgi:hypothetical protein
MCGRLLARFVAQSRAGVRAHIAGYRAVRIGWERVDLSAPDRPGRSSDALTGTGVSTQADRLRTPQRCELDKWRDLDDLRTGATTRAAPLKWIPRNRQIGEPGSFVVYGAVGNAVSRASGVKQYRYPFRPIDLIPSPNP